MEAYSESFPGGLVVENRPAKAGDMSLIPALGRSLGEGNGNPFQYSCLGNPMDRRAWWATVHRVAKESYTIQRLNNTTIFIQGEKVIPGHAQQEAEIMRNLKSVLESVHHAHAVCHFLETVLVSWDCHNKAP